jgi:uncharacterized protein YyaL (SSP411 family)
VAATNRLILETSPYLLQHAHNPVDWYPWGEEAFSRARAEDRPILLSVGYSACHWCHVMERESFENPAIAALMNQHFVSVKVDREERPDVDDVYMKAVQVLTGHGGWPMTVFLTPDLKPFYGGTYFPPVDRHGLPGFPRVLEAVARAYHERPDDITRSAGQILDRLAGLEMVGDSGGAPLDPELPQRAAEALLRHVDQNQGGLGGAPKFPHPAVFQLFLRRHRVTRDPALLEVVTLTADRMAAGGIYDHVGGGFHRYSVDARWLVPHFEKMLYDNAQIPRLYLEGHQVTGNGDWRRVVEETLDYVIVGLGHPDGGFYSATDADSEGEEGRYFVWRRDEVEKLVEPRDLDLVCRYWDVSEGGNFEGHNILHATITAEQAARLFGRSPEEVRAAIDRARARLLQARSSRVPPLRDEKILTSWNALMIGTLAEAGRVLREARFVAAAARAAEFVWEQMRDGGRLLHGWARGRAKQGAFLDDHANLASALVDLYEATGERRHLERARELVAALDARFRDIQGGAYFFTAHDEERLIARSKSGADSSVPSGNAVAAHALLRLHHLTGDATCLERAEEILRVYQGEAGRNPFGYATYLQALELYSEGPTEVIVVADDAGAAKTFWDAVARVYLPHRTLVAATPGDPMPLAPAKDRPAVGGRPTAYVCRHFTCSAPVTTPEELGRLLQES